MLKSYRQFINEAEKVALKKPLREYTLVHLNDDKFQIKSEDIFKEISVLPYRKELNKNLVVAQSKIIEAVNSEICSELFSVIKLCESIPYDYGKIFASKFSLKEIPELLNSITDEQRHVINSSEREFILNNFSQLGKSIKDSLITIMRERLEILCVVIEAVFYYTRIIDKDNFYEGLNFKELIEKFTDAIFDSSKELDFSFTGPFENTENEKNVNDESKIGYWHCEKNKKEFFIKASINPRDLYNEETIGGKKGLKCSIVTIHDEIKHNDYDTFLLTELTSRIKTFYNNILKKKRNGK